MFEEVDDLLVFPHFRFAEAAAFYIGFDFAVDPLESSLDGFANAHPLDVALPYLVVLDPVEVATRLETDCSE